MDNLKKTLNDFLSDQEERLSKRTYKDYRNVIQLLEDYLNGYAYMSLSKEEQEKFSDIHSAINKVKDFLPKVAELSNLIYDESQKNEYNNYSSYVEGNYVITKVKSGKLWFKDYMNNKDEIGPVIVSKKITDLAVEDLFVYLKLGEKGNKYYIVNSGNVYPVS